MSTFKIEGDNNFVAGRDINIHAAGPALHASGITRELLVERRQGLVNSYNANKRLYWANVYFFWLLAGLVTVFTTFFHLGLRAISTIGFEAILVCAFGGLVFPGLLLSARSQGIDARNNSIKLQVQAIDQALATMP